MKKSSPTIQVKEVKKPAPSGTGDHNRTATGIPGFDELVQGGFPTGSSILICGGPGTGKSIFSMQYLINGAQKFNEKCLYVTFEQTEEALREQGKQFGWDIEGLQKKGLLNIMAISIDKLTPKTINDIREFVQKKEIKRLVVDSLSTLVINAPIYTSPSNMALEDVMGENVTLSAPIVGDYIVKRFIYNFIEKLRSLECTSLLIGEAVQGGEFISRDGLSEFVCDGVVLINFESMGGAYSRSLIVRKMRQTKNNEDVHPVEISTSGIVIHKIE